MSYPNSEPTLTRGEVRNPLRSDGDLDQEKALDERADQDFQDLLRRHRRDTADHPPLKSASRISQKVAEWAGREVPGLTEDVRELEAEREAALGADYSRDWPSVAPHGMGVDVFAGTHSSYGEFWWAKSEWHWPGGMGVAPLGDGLHLFGGINYKADPPLYTSIGVTSHYGLSADRRPPSASGRYRSAPNSDVRGDVAGFQGLYHPIWHADDKRCNCALFLRQTAWQFAQNVRWVQLAERTSSWRFIHMENIYGVAQRRVHLGGFTPMPSIDFGLADPAAIIWIQSEIRFDINLEGDASIGFSPGPNPTNSVVTNQPQWNIQPI
jgi:hypothetical protein